MTKSFLRQVGNTFERGYKSLTGMVEYVTDLVFDGAGNFRGLGGKSDDSEGHAIEGVAGWHLGFYSRPLDGAQGVVLKAGGKGGFSVLVGYRNHEFEISLEKGEVAMANEAGAVVKLDKDGNVVITPKTGYVVKIAGEDFALLKTDSFLSDLATALGDIPVPPSTNYPGLSNAVDWAQFLVDLAGTTYKSSKAKNG